MHPGVQEEIVAARVAIHDRDDIGYGGALFTDDVAGAIAKYANTLPQVPILFAVIAEAKDDCLTALFTQVAKIIAKRVLEVGGHPRVYRSLGHFGIPIGRRGTALEPFLDLVVQQPDQDALSFQESCLIRVIGTNAPALVGQ